MKKIRFSVLLLLGLALPAFGAELFHFNFSSADGKKELTNGAFTLRSNNAPLLVQQNALRLASGADIEIDGPLPDLRKGFSAAAWFLKKRDTDLCPILSRGKFNDVQQFVFTTGPELYWRKVRTPIGLNTGSKIKKNDHWNHVVAVYRDRRCQLYLNGQPVGEGAFRQPLPRQDGPLLLGFEKNATKKMNYSNADMLLNDLRFFDHALSADEVGQLYAREQSGYPAGSQRPAGASARQILQPCFHYAYAAFGYDPDFEHDLKITRDWRPTPPAAEPLKGEIRTAPGDWPVLTINGKKTVPYQLDATGMYVHERRDIEGVKNAARDFGAAGVDLVRVEIGMGHPGYGDEIWSDRGQYDFRPVDEVIGKALEGNPGAALTVSIGVGTQFPGWFRKRYPEEFEKVRLPNGSLNITNVGAPLASDLYWKEYCSYLEALVRHMESMPYAKRIYAYCVGGGRSGEWYWPGTFAPGWPGYSQPTEARFREWLKNRYENDDALRAAWHDDEVTLETAKVPLPAEREKSETLTLRDPQKAGAALDFRHFLSDRTFQCLTEAVKTVKRASGGKLVSTYGGYSFTNDIPTHVGGRNWAGRLLRLPECDITHLALYYDATRMPGGAGLCFNPYNGSTALHGKINMVEADLRTSLYPNMEPRQWYRRYDSPEETAAIIERNLAMAMLRGEGLYEMTLCGLASYHDETIMAGVQRSHEAGKRMVSAPRHSVAEVALIFDETSAHYFAFQTPENASYFRALMHQFFQNSPRAGLPMDVYTIEDMAEGTMKDYKLYIFLNAVAVSPEMRAAVTRKLERNHAASLWVMAPGFIDGGKFSPDGMEKLTGIPFEVDYASAKLSVNGVPGSPLFKYRPPVRTLNYGPVFTPKGDGLKVHATAAGKPALVEKQLGKRKSFYTLEPPTPELVRGLAEYCGLHVYLNTPDVFNIDSRFALIHAATTGRKTVTLPQTADVFDAFTGRKLFGKVRKFDVKLKQYENGFYEIKPCNQ